jgi:hypothetical protein
MMIINDDSRVIAKLETSLTDSARVVIYDRHMFIVQATGKNFNGFFELVFTILHFHFAILAPIGL